ncbi:MAG TPA: ABC transporter permease [Arenimonas sp.]|uniref:ABC transporter permease n=1 Tax=Arenimonas sp. TaxID=1872635 RepID=UPI002CC607AA|nr:ABC transporter permease [Arenimonas sp.]HMB58061.1 ABC transporter permease [Arenimonas sp.]
MNFTRLFAIVIKELRQLRRDRITFGMILGIPTLQLLLFGFAINLDIRHIDAGVVDQAQTAHSREILAGLDATGVMTVRAQVTTPEQLQTLMRRGRISIGLVIPPDLERRLETRDRPALQVMVDGSDQTVQAAARQLAVMPLPGMRANYQGVEVVNFYNPERRAPVNTVPGLIGVILTMTLVMFTAMALVRERERGNLEMLIATPVSPWELTIGKVLPFIAIGLVQVTVVLTLGKLVFAVPIRGSLLEVYAAALLFIIANLSLGIFISTLAKSQFQAMQMAFFTLLPQILLSGFMFPYAGMPRAAQWLSEVLPMTHFIRLIRGIMLRGAELTDLPNDLLALAAIATVLLIISTRRISKRLD